MTRVKASETAPRVAPNSACTTGSTTTTDHIPTLPIEPISTASASRTHAWREVGDEGGGIFGWIEGACTGRNFVGRGSRVKRRDEMLGMQMRWNRPRAVIPGRALRANPESQTALIASGFRVRTAQGARAAPGDDDGRR